MFCRNVLIYFDQPLKMDVLSRIARVTEPHGYLLLGAAETVVGLTEDFKPHGEKRGHYVAASSTPQAALRAVPSLSLAPQSVSAGAA